MLKKVTAVVMAAAMTIISLVVTEDRERLLIR